MQTIDNIKKGLACFAQDRSYMLPCSDCAYHGQGLPHCRKAVHEDALELIRLLEADVKIEKIKRNAAYAKMEQLESQYHRPEDCVNYATRTRDGRAVCLGTRELDPCDGAGCKRWKAKKNGGTEDA